MKLSGHDEKRIHNFYQAALDRFGEDDVRSVQWTSLYGQKRRFEVLLNVGDVTGHSILDVGCGLGDLYKFMLERDIRADYTGIDIIPEFIKTAKVKYPNAQFYHQDIFETEEKFDYVLASGALSFKVQNNDDHYKRMILKMYEVASKAVAFNMLDNATHVDNETYAAYSPHEVVDFCSGFANSVEVTTDYLPQDFTVYLYR